MGVIGRIIVGVVGVGVALAVGAAGFVYWRSEALMHPHYPVLPEPVRPALAADIARGRHLVDITGCRECHRANLRGGDFPDMGDQGAAYTANLTLFLKAHSREDLARVLRRGIKPDGEGVAIMPSSGFFNLTDQDIADIDAYLRTFPAGGPVQPALHLTWSGRLQALSGQLTPAIKDVRDGAGKLPANFGPAYAEGRRLVSIACIECHGPELKGYPGQTPDLVIAAAYDLPTFARFMGTGVAMDDKQKPLMSTVARDRFSHFSAAEVKAIHDYLSARAGITP